jgi:hypothetical protein
VEIEGGPYADKRGGTQAADMGGHPFLLLAGAESDPHEIWGSGIDPRRD